MEQALVSPKEPPRGGSFVFIDVYIEKRQYHNGCTFVLQSRHSAGHNCSLLEKIMGFTIMGEKSEQKYVPAHESFMQKVAPIGTWSEWLKLAYAATSFEQKVGLLHAGFDVKMGRREMYGAPDYTPFDRLEFYFGVADGWTESDHFRTKGVSWQDEPEYEVGHDKNWNRIRRKESDQRQLLARKAFSMLVSKYFTELSWVEEANYNGRETGGEHEIRRFLSSPEFLAIQKFFRVEEGRVYNLSSKRDEENHWQKKIFEFLLWLPPLLWNWTEKEIRSYDSEEVIQKKELQNLTEAGVVAEAKIWMIEVLSALDELDLLERWILELDEPCLAKLKELALRNTFRSHAWPVSSDRPVANLEEACFLNSPAAWLLKKHGVMTAEYFRLVSISNAEKEIEAAQRKVAALSQPAK